MEGVCKVFPVDNLVTLPRAVILSRFKNLTIQKGKTTPPSLADG